MNDEIEYFVVKDENNYYIGKWIKKPKNKDMILNGIKVVKRRGAIIKIGVDKKLIKRIIFLYDEKIKYGSVKEDKKVAVQYASETLQLTSGLVKEILSAKSR